MRSGMAERRFLVVLGILALFVVLMSNAFGLRTGSASAGPLPPANDDFANAIVVPEPLPFSHAIDASAASIEIDEPTFPCSTGFDLSATVWYSFTPSSDVIVTAKTSFASHAVVPYVGNDLLTLASAVCYGVQDFPRQEVVFTASAGVTYTFQVGFLEFAAPGNIDFSLSAKPPPAKGNDDFAGSVVIAEPLPFTNTQSIRGGTLEANEPQSCSQKEQTVWYSHTPSHDTGLRASVHSDDFSLFSSFNAEIAVYEGGSLGTLTLVSCRFFDSFITSRIFLEASAGTTYYFQVGAVSDSPGDLVFQLSSTGEVAMNVTGGFCDDPVRPTTCDVPVGEEFGLSVDALAVPPEGYILMQTYVDFGDELSYEPTASANDEITWPDCNSATAVRAQFDGTLPLGQRDTESKVHHGCITGLFSTPTSRHVGSLVEITLTCSQQASSTDVRLLAYHDTAVFGGSSTAAETLGTLFTLANRFATIAVPKLGDLTINCVAPTAVGGISLDSDLRALPLETTDSERWPWAVALWIVAAASLAAVSGVGWYARRRATG